MKRLPTPSSELRSRASEATRRGPRHAPVDAATRRRQTLKVVVAGAVVVGILFAFVFPVRTYVGQRGAIDAAATTVDVLEEQNRRLSARADQLETDAEIERLARQEYGMVRPGEEPYAILPAPGPRAPSLPGIFGQPAPETKEDKGVVGRILDALTFWDG